ncbi:hypothetical protein [Pseudomonas guariconensis]|uniref:hypothetical protein n=1 Tax=Pseudomonas guariconensis TaxID=1288410 RepID=UPI002B058ADA|nr:hypothetical protein [Pseudomonas guariconensis]
MKYWRKRGSFHLGMRIESGFALIASILANQTRDQKKRPEPYTPADFSPHLDQVATSLGVAMETWT